MATRTRLVRSVSPKPSTPEPYQVVPGPGPGPGADTGDGTMWRVEARKNPEYLKALAAAVTEFREALDDLLDLYVQNGDAGGLGGFARGIAPAVLLREGADLKEVARRQARVSRAAGRAGAAVPLTDVSIVVQGAGVVDPIANWQTITRPKPLLEVVDVLGACDHALGRLVPTPFS